MIWLLVALAITDPCDALCRRDGYSYGKKISGNCHCTDNKGPIDDFIHRKITLPYDGIDEKPQSVIYLRAGDD